MANILSKTGITTNSTIRTWHVTQSIDAFTKVEAYDITISGSLKVTGSLLPNSSITGTLITSASYADKSRYSPNALTAQNVSYANVAPDTLMIQLHHGIVQTPVAGAIYYFALNPITGSTGGTLPTASGRTGIYPPAAMYILSASLSSTVNGTLATYESSSYSLFVGGNGFPLNTFNLSEPFTSSITGIGGETWSPDELMYVSWRTPTTWSTPPTQVSHNLVLYCTRNSNPL